MNSRALHSFAIALFFAPLMIGNLFAAVQPIVDGSDVTSTSVTLSWTAADNGRVSYSIFQYDDASCDTGQVSIGTTNQRELTVSGLDAETYYYFKVEADTRKGGNVSSDCAQILTAMDVVDPPGACNYPAFSDPPGGSGTQDFIRPVWLEPESNPELVFHDDFDGLNIEKWFDDQMIDALNRTGNRGIDAEGNMCMLNINPICSAIGKRHSAWYNENLDQNRVRNDVESVLEIRGTADALPDPTRPGAGSPWENTRLSTAFMTTWARELENNSYVESSTVADGKDKWTFPMYLETRVSFEQMKTPGFRLSMWLMPATYDDPDDGPATLATNDEAYNGNFSDGFEIDIFEYEPWKPECGNLLEFSWINSFATRGKSGRNASGKNHFEGDEEGYDMRDGWYTFGLLWEEDRIQWVFDGRVVLEITDDAKIPDIYQYLIVSREMTNGLSSGVKAYDGQGYFLPPEPGLYGPSGGSDIGNYIDNISDDIAKIDYIKIFKPSP